MTVNLTFCGEWNPAPGHVDLVFGVDPCAVGSDGHSVTIDALLPAPVTDIAIGGGHGVSVAATIAPPLAAVAVWYDIAVWRGIAANIDAAHEAAYPLKSDVCDGFSQSISIKTTICDPVSAAVSMPGLVCAGWADSVRIKPIECILFADATHRDAASVCAPFAQLDVIRDALCDQWAQAGRINTDAVCMPWISLRKTARPLVCEYWGAAAHGNKYYCSRQQQAVQLDARICMPWDGGDYIGGWGGQLPPEPPKPPEPPCYNPTPGLAQLVFAELAVTRPDLVFRCPGDGGAPPPGQIIVPVMRVYFMLNEARLFRVSDNTEIPVLSATASIDADSWVWAMSAAVPIDAQTLVQDDGTGPVELKLVINSYEFRFMAENLRRNRTFSGKSLSISGRGMAATLDAPYADAVTYDNAAQARTVVQLMEGALTVNGQSIGWTIDATEITDWLAPAGAWSHTGSHISAINSIAGAINALVQADPTGQTIRIRPRYPLMPWEWDSSATPGVVLPENVVVQEGVEWVKSPAHNAVYVSGASQGVLGRAIVEGTAGDDYAEMVTHDLITHADAVRQRGASILGATGRRQRVSLSMPIGGDTQLPIIQPNTFIDYGPLGIGLSRGVRVDANRPAFRQTVDVEVYLGR